MAKRTLEESFLLKLEQMCIQAPNGRVSSRALEDALGWTVEGRFSVVRANLIRKNLVRASPGGAGGVLECVKATEPPIVSPLKAFISYAHVDKPMKNELVKHLDPLRRRGIIQNWHDGDIVAGKEWEKEIWSQLRSADLVLLLISIDFINSEYCYDRELAAAVERHKANKARIIPIIYRACLWDDLAFSHVQAVLGGKSIESQANRDEALTQVAREIKAAADELRAERGKEA